MKKNKELSLNTLLLSVIICIAFIIIIVSVASQPNKDPCLTNPTKDGCICDEYQGDKIKHSMWDDVRMIGGSLEYYQDMNNLTLFDDSTNVAYNELYNYLYLESVHSIVCVRAHSPKDECEKGNENYIIEEICPLSDSDKIYNPNNLSQFVTVNINSWKAKYGCCLNVIEDKYNLSSYGLICDFHPPMNEVCRHKTLDEYSCEELKTYIDENDRYCYDTNKWLSETNPWSITDRRCSSWKLPQEDIKMNLFYYKNCETNLSVGIKIDCNIQPYIEVSK